MRHIEHLMPTATSSCMFASGQILFRISPDRVTGVLAAALGGGRARAFWGGPGAVQGPEPGLVRARDPARMACPLACPRA